MSKAMHTGDAWRGGLILAAVVLAFVIGAIVLTDDGLQKFNCVGRALAGGVSLGNVHSVCGF